MTFNIYRQLWQLKPGDEFHLVMRDKKDKVVRRVIGAGDVHYIISDGETIDKLPKHTQVIHLKKY